MTSQFTTAGDAHENNVRREEEEEEKLPRTAPDDIQMISFLFDFNYYFVLPIPNAISNFFGK